MKRIYIVLLSMCLIFSLFSCSSNHKKSIKDISTIKDQYPASIIVTFNDEYKGSFEITEATLITQVIDLLNAREYKFSKKSPAPGSSRSLTLKYESGEEVKISTRVIRADNGYYVPSSQDDLDSILQEYGIAEGTVMPRQSNEIYT